MSVGRRRGGVSRRRRGGISRRRRGGGVAKRLGNEPYISKVWSTRGVSLSDIERREVPKLRRCVQLYSTYSVGRYSCSARAQVHFIARLLRKVEQNSAAQENSSALLRFPFALRNERIFYRAWVKVFLHFFFSPIFSRFFPVDLIWPSVFV